jgi:HTH-type transcriptional regulator/antitoxin HigA
MVFLSFRCIFDIANSQYLNMTDRNKDFNVDSLLNSLFEPRSKETLNDLFEKRVKELKISATSVLDIVGISYRPLKGILSGTQKTVDYTNLIKLANFLQVPKEKVIQLHMEALERNFPEDNPVSPDVVKFIKENFDLVALRKSKFISSITDFKEIESKLLSLFGIKTIFEYQKPHVDVAFSAGVTTPANEDIRATWIKTAETVFEEIGNPYEYNRKGLLEYFPQIRWHSTNVDRGLMEVIRDLYKLGVTVIYQEKLQGLNRLNGATFPVNGKPCVVLSNYTGFYPTLWFALVHELFHVLFDWDEILNNGYHLSDEDNDILTVREKEEEADNFAREYLFSKEKTMQVKPFLNNDDYVQKFAENNHVHKSFVYVFYARDVKDGNGTYWAKARVQNPPIDGLVATINNPWEKRIPTNEYVKYLKDKIYKQ